MWNDLASARNVVTEFLPRGHQSSWDKMIADPLQGPHGCLMQFVTTTLGNDRWPEVGFTAGRELRRLLPNVGAKKWKAIEWKNEIDRILEVTFAQIQECEAKPAASLERTEPMTTEPATNESSEFAPWRLFRHRHEHVPTAPGVYVFGYFTAAPDSVVNPMSERVIYIGFTGKESSRRTLRQRLDEFEDTAMDKPGHSAGWTYRTEFAQDWESLVTFRNTYVTWRSFPPNCANEPYELEQRLLREYQDKWGRQPFLNRK